MAIYYTSNALCGYIDKNKIPNLYFSSGNLWQLVYGNANCEPKLLVLVSGVNSDLLRKPLTLEEQISFNTLNQLSKITKVDIRFIRFAIDKLEVNEVLTIKNTGKLQTVNMTELTELFREDGLPVNNNRSSKCLNDKTSSAYHNWQRSSLGRELTVSDFDLWKKDDLGNLIRLYELKRSVISLNRWEPYAVDYNNFRLISNLFSGTNIDFKIVYNVRTKEPCHDDISQLKIYNVGNGNDFIQYFDTLSLADFLII